MFQIEGLTELRASCVRQEDTQQNQRRRLVVL